MNCRFKPGDLVVYQFTHHCLHGIVLSVKLSPGAFRDRACLDPFDAVYALEVLWDRDVPFWMGEGRIAYITDSAVNLFEEVLSEPG